MKIRYGFVGNSSSSSFVIEKKNLTKEQIDMIVNHGEIATAAKLECCDEPWQIIDGDDHIGGYTTIDNFDMYHYLTEMVKVLKEHIEIEGSNWDGNCFAGYPDYR